MSRVEDSYMFVRLPKGKTGFLHVSNLAQKPAGSLSTHFKIGGKVKVVINSIGQDGKIAVKEAR
ncbi:MAG: S1 RNA-binding domain-containing protein [Candidatus Peribacteria bacterium]|nr:S1 RNA-binding domain-containing protein [Candidatus Peribacteria bacterium]